MDATSDRVVRENLFVEADVNRDLKNKWTEYYNFVYLRAKDIEARETLSYWGLLTNE